MRRELRFLVVAVVVMLAGVVASLVILQRASRSLSEAHEIVVGDAAPSVVALDEAQARLRELHMLVLERELGAPGDPAVRDAAIAAGRRDLDREIGDYLAMTTDPGEVALQRTIRDARAHLDMVVDRALSLTPGQAGANGARHDLDAAITRLGLDLAQASAFSANLAQLAAARVVYVSQTVLPLAAAIEGLTFLAAALTLLLTYRAVRRAEALWADSHASLDRRAEELELFAGRVAHDLLSPLMTVALAMDLASRRLTDPEDAAARSAIARGTRTLQRVRHFVTDLLEFARAGARPAPGMRAGVAEAVREIADELNPVAEDAGVELRVESDPAGREVACSPGVLSSVLSNLVQNAIKYMGDAEVRRVSIRTAERDGEVQVEVEDTGPGLPATGGDRLFEPYARGHDAKVPGLGLGLATVRRLVESHGGRVGVHPASDRGSVFWFSLPAAG